MKTAVFDYELPDSLIAQQPADRRDAARLMVIDRESGALDHRRFSELPGLLHANDILVVNDTRVLPARLFGEKAATGGAVEVLLLEPTGPNQWEALLRCSRRPSPGDRLVLGRSRVEVLFAAELGDGRCTVAFAPAFDVVAWMEEEGEPPLPPYIQRDVPLPGDREAYQTIYAAVPGAVAAPTAGLHFTDEVFRALAARGVDRCAVTLHVGLGTFRPVAAEDVADHVMHEERYHLPREAVEGIQRARHAGGRVVGAGTTTVRTLETAAAADGTITAGDGRSSLFIYPPYRFRVIDVLVTNFHLPRSSLLMMVCAFAGTDLVLEAYREAVREAYRFYSYGDCMVIL